MHYQQWHKSKYMHKLFSFFLSLSLSLLSPLSPSLSPSISVSVFLSAATLNSGLHDAQTGDGGVPEEVQCQKETQGTVPTVHFLTRSWEENKFSFSWFSLYLSLITSPFHSQTSTHSAWNNELISLSDSRLLTAGSMNALLLFLGLACSSFTFSLSLSLVYLSFLFPPFLSPPSSQGAILTTMLVTRNFSGMPVSALLLPLFSSLCMPYEVQ